jgi:predicted MFS family arabinose efflux permease
MKLPPTTQPVITLGIAQTLAWASTYYLPAMLAPAMARDLGVEMPTVFAAFSLALVVSALLGPSAGKAIDRWGGRPVLAATSLVFAAGLTLLASAQTISGLVVAWLILGVGMGSGLYEAAFAALVRLYGTEARNAITGITLFAGFASTIGWPLSSAMASEFGWRGACLGWALLHLAVGLPLNLKLARAARAGSATTGASTQAEPVSAPRVAPQAAALLAYVFAVTWFISTAMAAHLPRLLQACGTTLAGAVAIGALVGPAQVAGRLLEFGLLRRVHPLLSARLAALMHPIGATLLVVFGVPAAAPFALLHGAGNGVLTIAKGTLPLVIFGAHGYGHRQGWLMVPARFAQALSPWIFGLSLDRWGASALWVSVALGMTAFIAMMLLPRPDEDQSASRASAERTTAS